MLGAIGVSGRWREPAVRRRIFTSYAETGKGFRPMEETHLSKRRRS
jgi:hypothetical protein